MENSEGLETRKIAHDEPIVSWEASEYIHYEKSPVWYLVAGVIFLGIVGFSIYKKDWFFLVVLPFVIAGIFMYLKSRPNVHTYSISQTGFSINDSFYSYNDIRSFWIIYNQHVKTLNILPNKKITPLISVELAEEDPVVIQKILSKYLPEEEKREENFVDKIIRVLKF